MRRRDGRKHVASCRPNVAYRGVHASRGKVTRAEPVAALYEQHRVKHVGTFPELEDQICSFAPGFSGSPDRLDALVWALSDLMVSAPMASWGIYEIYRQELQLTSVAEQRPSIAERSDRICMQKPSNSEIQLPLTDRGRRMTRPRCVRLGVRWPRGASVAVAESASASAGLGSPEYLYGTHRAAKPLGSSPGFAGVAVEV